MVNHFVTGELVDINIDLLATLSTKMKAQFVHGTWHAISVQPARIYKAEQHRLQNTQNATAN